MPKHEVRLSARVAAPIEKVFAFFADHEQFATLFGGHARRIKEGQDEPNGLGSARCCGPAPISFDETIVAFERNRQIDYRITRGSPLKNHLGRIRFSSDGGGTAIDYLIRFDARIPGTGGLIAKLLSTGWNSNSPRVLKQLEAG